jgi:hypothetical protein
MKMSKAFPCFEYPKPLCSCGRELSTAFYFLAAEKSFKEFANTMGESEITERMGFSTNIEEDLRRITNGKICCLSTLRLGTVSVISVNKGDDPNRVYPSALPGPTSSNNVLYWADVEAV